MNAPVEVINEIPVRTAVNGAWFKGSGSGKADVAGRQGRKSCVVVVQVVNPQLKLLLQFGQQLAVLLEGGGDCAQRARLTSHVLGQLDQDFDKLRVHLDSWSEERVGQGATKTQAAEAWSD